MAIPQAFFPGKRGPGKRGTPSKRFSAAGTGTPIQSNVSGGVTIVTLYGQWAYRFATLSDDESLAGAVNFYLVEDGLLGTATLVVAYRLPGLTDDGDLPQQAAAFQADDDGLFGQAMFSVPYRFGFSDDADLPGAVNFYLDEDALFSSLFTAWAFRPGVFADEDLFAQAVAFALDEDPGYLTAMAKWALARGFSDEGEFTFPFAPDDDGLSAGTVASWLVRPGFLDDPDVGFTLIAFGLEDDPLYLTKTAVWCTVCGLLDDAEFTFPFAPDDDGVTAGKITSWLLVQGFRDNEVLGFAVVTIVDEDDTVTGVKVVPWPIAPGFTDDADLPGAKNFHLNEDWYHSARASWAWPAKPVGVPRDLDIEEASALLSAQVSAQPFDVRLGARPNVSVPHMGATAIYAIRARAVPVISKRLRLIRGWTKIP